MLEQLPKSREVNVSALSRLLSDTTNSYKYVFLLSILDLIKRESFSNPAHIQFRGLVTEMLANVWYPHTYFRLSFGTQDKIVQRLESLQLDFHSSSLKTTDSDKKALREEIYSKDLDGTVRSLLRYVPFRLIVPFLENELKQVPNRTKGNNLDRAIPGIAATVFDEVKPLYRFNSDKYSECSSLIIHPDWITYLEKHYSIVRGWISWNWLSYMQKRNPSTPGLIYKLFAPTKRESLAKQTNYWKIILESTDFHCIYSGQKIDVGRFSLDHYLPWSFVAHDQLWNLIPTLPEINSSKSNNLPSPQFFDKFVEAQHRGLVVCKQKMSGKEWVKKTEVYIEDLSIKGQSDLLDLEKLKAAYLCVIPSLTSLAENQGFRIWEPPVAVAQDIA